MKPYYETKLGKLYHGDCLDIMPQLEPVDLVISDIPYGIDYQCAMRIDKASRLPKISNDKDLSFIPKLMELSFKISKQDAHAYFFCRWDKWPLDSAPWKPTNMIVWDKLQHGTGDLFNSYGPQHELILFATRGRKGFAGKRPVDVIRSPKVPAQQLLHSCQKPIGLIQELLKNSSIEKDIVLDPFSGSSTTAIACEQLSSRWICIEIDEKNCEISAKRLKQETSQLKLF